MADESHYSTGADATVTNKRKYDDQTPPPARRSTGFSSPDSAHAPQSYNNVPPPVDEIQMAKQKAQEIAARLLSGAGADIKRPRVENGASGFDSMENKGFSSAPSDGRSFSNSAPSSIPVSYGSYGGGSSKKIEIPNGRVGVLIGKGGETIKNLQLQSGAKIQVTRDMDSDPNATTRLVDLMGSTEQIARAEQLINDLLAEADAGGSGTASRRFTGQGGSDTFVMKVANNKVGLVIGKGGETIKTMQAKSGARIQVIPLHLPPGDTSTERNVHIEGTSDQVEYAKQLVIEVTSENRGRNQSVGGGSYPQQGGYQARPQTGWTQPGPQGQQTGYGYPQQGAYPQYTQPPYSGYPPQQSSGGYQSNWDQSNPSAGQQTGQQTGQVYDYYPSQQPTPTGSTPPPDSTSYNYGQPQGGYSQDGYGGGYGQPGYGQPPAYDQQHGYSAPSYGGSSQDGTQGDSTNNPPASGQPAQQGYGLPGQYGSSYGAPQTQKPPGSTPPAYGQAQQSPTTAGGYGQQGYGASGYYGQPGYGQGAPGPYNAYGGGGYSQAAAAYSGDGGGGATQAVQPGGGVAKASPQG